MSAVLFFSFPVHPRFSVKEKGTAEAIPSLTLGSMKNTLYEADAFAQSDK